MTRARLPELDPMPDVASLAWAAGLIDGEGAIGLQHSRSRAAEARTTAGSWRLRLRVAMTHEPTVARLSELFGGRVRPLPEREGRRPAWYWEVDQPLAEAVLRSLWPYLVTRREHAGLAIAAMTYRRHVRLIPSGGVGGHRLPTETHDVLTGFYRRIGALNTKGPEQR